MAENYRPRLMDELLKRKLKGIGAVLLEGAAGCGKTATALQLAKSAVFMADAERGGNNMALAQLQPRLLLKDESPRLIDEWQAAPQLWDAVRFEVDQRQATGQFILTGSVEPVDGSKIWHSGTGRITRLRQRTMSLFESGESNGCVSLGGLFDGQFAVGKSKLTYETVAFLTCRGGWPAALRLPSENALRVAEECCATAVDGLSRADGVKRKADWMKRLMRAFALHQGTPLPLTDVSKALQADGQYVSTKTLSDYAEALERGFVEEDVPAWRPALCTRTAVRTTPARAFADPSFGAVALGIGPMDLMRQPEMFELLVKTLCLRDLRIYADWLDGMVYHYRDKTNLACAAVLQRRNGAYGLIEIKLGGEEAIELGAETLKALAGKIDSTRMAKPAFLMVLTGIEGVAYRREDGVYVVPIGCLKY